MQRVADLELQHVRVAGFRVWDFGFRVLWFRG